MSSRQRLFMPSQYARAETADLLPAPRAPVGRETYRHRSATHEEWRAQRLAEGLGRVRIAGRHSSAPLTPREVAEIFSRDHIPADLIEAAYASGLRDRASGVRCMCSTCLGLRDPKEERL